MDLNSFPSCIFPMALAMVCGFFLRPQTRQITQQNRCDLWSEISHGSYIF